MEALAEAAARPQASTDWQIRPARLDPMASNDHAGWGWDGRVLRTLAA